VPGGLGGAYADARCAFVLGAVWLYRAKSMTSSARSLPQASALIASQDLDSLRESVAKVLARECDSRAIHDYLDGKNNLGATLWARAAEQGWLAAALPERWGGLGLGAQGLCVLHAELGRRTAPGPFVATLSVAQWIAETADDAIKQRFLPLLANGEFKAALPVSFSDQATLALANGKVSGSLDVLGSEDAGLVLAPYGKDCAVEGWVLVETKKDALTLARKPIWDLTREVCAFTCEGAAIVANFADGDGALGRRILRHVALALGADSLGAATTIAHQTVEYTKTRVQFDKPIGSFQAIKHRAADMVIRIHTHRHVLDHAVEAVAMNLPDADMWAALAKVQLTEAFAYVAHDCIQLHGGVGHTWEFDPHIYAKRARLSEALATTNRRALDFAAQALVRASEDGRAVSELNL
jgi:alkylation response protein AidB-like acyl-CoA dehydrogenase